MKIKHILSVVLLGALVALSGCSGDQKTAAVTENGNIKKLPQVIRRLIKSSQSGDAKQFADLVYYPLQRPYPLKDINSKAEMEAYYGILMDDSIRNIISNSKASQWGEFGWRGWSLDDGQYIWIDEGIYAVPYMSKREIQISDSLTNIEIASLPKQIREGWKPILTLKNENDGYIYRIDKRLEDIADESAHYRLCVYEKGSDYLKMPDELMDGVMTVEGSAMVVNYIFHDGKNQEYRILPESMTTGTAVLTTPDGNDIELVNAYWYDLVGK